MSENTTASTNAELDRLSANAIRALAIDSVQKANSGHPGLPLGMADAAYVLWRRFLKHNPHDPNWPDRDRFVLSAGHGSMLLYALLHLTGYDLSIDDLKQFRQWGSKTPGHPEHFETPGVETTTGPLGQGVGNAVGLAIAERWLAAKFNRGGFPVFDHYTYVVCSDGDLMEGISHEAASLAGHLKLGKLIMLYDSNSISLVGATSLSFSEDVPARFSAYGWHILEVDGHDMAAVAHALAEAKAERERPSIIVTRTTIGFGSPNKAGSHKAHGEPLGADEVRLTKENLGWPTEPDFYVPDQVYEHMHAAIDAGSVRQREWNGMMDRYRGAFPDLAATWDRMLAGELPADLAAALPSYAADPKGKGTRVFSGDAVTALAEQMPQLLGGSADLHTSDYTLLKAYEPLTPTDFSGRNIHFGVREHAMGSALNGMALHGGIIPYAGTFLVFSDYMRPAIRLAALMSLRIVYVFTHDSIGVGEDGPTHEPVEQVMALRMIPNLHVFRPGDANEVIQAWKAAVERKDGPTAMILSRQAAPTLDRSTMASAEGTARGGYVLRDTPGARVILIGTGTELHMAVQAADLLADRGIPARVVSLPSWEVFDSQEQAYRESVLPPSIPVRVSIEAGRTIGWERYVGLSGASVGVDRFGASAPFQEIYRRFGISAERMAEVAQSLLGE
ncbi:MAG: transketolase [Oscillochloris sp.]|nr:transketolase [Oscillochloris sp.]